MTIFSMREPVNLQLADGTVLSADLYRADRARAAAVILIRTPYGARDYVTSPQDGMTLKRMLADGFAVMIQDVRGTGDSGGLFTPLLHEREDGLETLHWIARQNWCNGRIATYGASYLGFTQFAMAVVPEAPITACVFINTAADAYRNWYYSEGGIFSVENTDRYAFFVAIQQSLREGQAARAASLQRISAKSSARLMDGGKQAAETLAAAKSSTWLDEVLAHPLRDRYWRSRSYSDEFVNVRAAGLHIGGWFDFFSGATVAAFLGLKDGAAQPTTRANQYLIMGPWTHMSMSGRYPYHDFGAQADATAFGLENVISTFLREDKVGNPLPTATYFMMGANEWRTSDSWPPAGTTKRRYYLDPGTSGACLLSDAAQTATSRIAVTLDMNHPVPTRGGRLLFGGDTWTDAGPADQRELERRTDVISFTTIAFRERQEIAGSLSLVVYVSTDMPDADVAVIITDVAPDGYSRMLCEGMGRLTLRAGPERELPVLRGEAYKISIDAGVTANAFLPNHRLRINISGTNFPNHALNPNLQRSGVNTGQFVIHTGGGCASYLNVPMVCA